MTTFTDDFNRADSTNLGANWVEVSGDWSIISQQLSSGNAGGTVILRAATAMTTNDHSVQITIAATAAVSHGIWARGNSNITQGYLLRNNGSSWDVFSVIGGSFTAIGTYGVGAAAGDIAKLQVVGTTIKAYINGVQRISVTDTAVATGTSVGVRSESTNSLRFDDFTAADIGNNVTGDAALTGTATLSATSLRATTGDTALTATAGLTADGTRAASAAAALTATATLTGSGAVTASGDTSVATSAALTASGQRATAGDSELVAVAALEAVGQRATASDADLAATAGLAAVGQASYSAAGALAATAVLAADGATSPAPLLGDAALTAAGILAAAGAHTASAGAGLAGDTALIATGTMALVGTAGVAATATLTASGATHSAHDDVDITVGAPYSPWAAGNPQDDGWKVGAPW